jgi:hypothetical protein
MADFSLGTLGNEIAPSPQSLAARRALALALQKEGTSTEPIRSPWQGVGRIAQSVFGGLDQYQTDQSELAARKQNGQALADALQKGDLGGAVAAMNSPWTNPEAGKLAVGLMTPQWVDAAGGKALVTREGKQIGFMPEVKNYPEKYGEGTEFNNLTIGTGDPRNPIAPLNIAPPNIGGRPAAAPPAGAVATRPAAPVSPPAAPVSPATQAKIDYTNQMLAERARQKKLAEGGAESMAEPIKEARKAGVTAERAIQDLDIIEDTVRNTPNLTTGPTAEQWTKFRQAIRGTTGKDIGEPKSLQSSEIIQKLNANLASAEVHALTQRGTQFDLYTYMKNNPGILTSREGTQFLTQIMRQIHQQDQGLDALANDKRNWENWPQAKRDYYKQNPIVNPITGNKFNPYDKHPQFSLTPTPDSIAHLKREPNLSGKFDELYGAGSAAKVLGR